MALRFIIGRAGCGKTHTCLEEIRQKLREHPDGNPLLFVVPEQATFQNEVALANTPGLNGAIRGQVVSFQRLAWHVLQEVGGAARPHIGDLGKRMIMRHILEEKKGQLQAFQRSVNQMGFVNCLADVFGEMKRYRISPEALSGVAGKLTEGEHGKLLENKINDIMLIYSALEENLTDKYIDPENYLNLLAEGLDKSETVVGSEVWMDGFTGFTPQEYYVVEKMLLTCQQVNIALCLDESYLDDTPYEDEVFYSLWETYKKLKGLAQNLGVEVLAPTILNDNNIPRFSDAPLLAHMEKYFFNRPTKVWDKDISNVSLVAAANRRTEVEGVAREILKLCREEGYRWRDISIVVRDLEGYYELVSTVFRAYQIPFFLDIKRSIMHHPLVELIRSALEVVSSNWIYDPVFRFFKTDFIPVSRDDIDRLENYVLAHGIRGSRWSDAKPWAYRRKYTLEEDSALADWETVELEQINEIRDKACAALWVFVSDVKKASNVKEICTAIYELLNNLNVHTQLETWRHSAEAAGNLDIALEHGQVWNSMIDLLDQTVEALGDEDITIENLLKVLDDGFTNLKLGLIPPGLDQVFVAALDRSRSPNVKACFVMGVNEGVLPARIKEDGVFTSVDRETLGGLGLEIAPGAKRRLFDEQFLTYVAVTRSSAKMWVSYALADEEGKALMPSLVIKRLQEILPGLTEKMWSVEPNHDETRDLEFIANTNRTLSYLGTKLREAKQGSIINPIWWDVYNYYVNDAINKEKAKTVLAGLFHINQEEFIGKNISRVLYGNKLKASVSRLEKFQACPFSHFASYGLKLKERAEYRLGAPDLGQFFHAALKNFADKLIDEGLEWKDLTEAECLKIINEIVTALVPKLQNEILMSTARHRYLTNKLRDMILTTVLILAEHAKRGEFKPVGLEIAFGDEGPLPSFNLNLGELGEMELAGRIDRIDVASQDENHYLRIIDYKSGKSGVDLSDIFHGLKMQLLAYLHITLSNSAILIENKARSGGMLYFNVQNPILSAGAPMEKEAADQERLKSFKMKGMMVADPTAVLLTDRNIKGHSDIIPIGMKKDGSFYQNNSGVTHEQFDALRNHLLKLLRHTGGQILDGLVSISPYKKGNFTSCNYCSYKPVCKFDELLEDNQYRNIKKEKSHEIWSKLIEDKGGKEDE